MSEADKLNDALERQSELIAALRNEIATKDKRIKELEGRNKQQELSILSFAESHKKQEQRIAEQAKRIAELEASHADLAHDQLEIAELLNGYGIEHSGFKKQAPRVEMLVERAREHARQRIEQIKKRKALEIRVAELEAAQPDGHTYSEGCKP